MGPQTEVLHNASNCHNVEEPRDRFNRLDCFDVLNKKDKMNNEMTGAKASATLVTGDRGRRPRLSSRFSGGTLLHSVYRSKCGVGSVSTSVGVFTKTDGGGMVWFLFFF